MTDIPVENAVEQQRLTVPMPDDEPPEAPTRDVPLETPGEDEYGCLAVKHAVFAIYAAPMRFRVRSRLTRRMSQRNRLTDRADGIRVAVEGDAPQRRLAPGFT